MPRNQLNCVEIGEFHTWLKSNRDMIEAGDHTYGELAVIAQASLGFEVTTSNIRGHVRRLGFSIARHCKPSIDEILRCQADLLARVEALEQWRDDHLRAPDMCHTPLLEVMS